MLRSSMTCCCLCLNTSRLRNIQTLTLHLTLVRMFTVTLTQANSIPLGAEYPVISGNTNKTETFAIERMWA
jgi:hypothetical protein